MGNQAEICTRRVPWHFWIRLFVVWGGEFERGHGWLYNCVRRDAWKIGAVGFGIIRMPYTRRLPSHLRRLHGLQVGGDTRA